MRILISGSEGSLAQMIIPEFLKAGYKVCGVDNFSRHGLIERKREYEFLHGDLTDTAFVKSLFADSSFDFMVHAAALVYGVVGFHQKPADIIVDNNLTTMNLLKYGANKIEKFVYLSSSMVYERCHNVPHEEEDADLSAVMSTSYGLSKYIGERVVKSFHEQYGTKYTIWRPFNIITPFEKPEETGYSHVFADMIRKIIFEQQNPLEIIGDGMQVRCFTNIRDVAEALAKYSFDQRSDNQIFNVANKEPLTVKELTQLIVEIGKEKGCLPASYKLVYKNLPSFADDVLTRIPDVKKMEQIFDWRAQISVRQSLSECIEHCLLKQGH